jgi:regulator of replication initiation timing
VARAKAYMQIEENINAFAALVDGIRNPLAIISGTAELSVENDDAKKRLLECVSKIDTIVSKLDKGWVESEKIREFLKRYI